MAFFSFKCPKEDALLKTLRNTYHATPLRVPDSTTRVMDVIAHRGRKSMRYGPVKPLVGLDAEPTIQTSELPDFSLIKSNQVTLAFGLSLMGQMLKGLGFGGGDLSSSLEGVTEISISIEGMKKIYAAPTAIGEILKGKKLDATHPAANLFTRSEQPFAMLVISNILVGNKMLFHLKGSRKKSVNVDVPSIKGFLEDAKVDLQSNGSTDKTLSFEGKDPLTFAFSCIQLQVDGGGRLMLGEIINPPVPKSVGSKETVPGPAQPRELSLMHETVPALIEFDVEE